MKKFVLSLLLMIVIIISAILMTNYLRKSSDSLVNKIDEISQLVIVGSWDEAKSKIDQLEQQWEKSKGKWAVLVDHFEIDNIDVSMIKSKNYINSMDLPLASAELENLKYMVGHIFEKEALNLENIF